MKQFLTIAAGLLAFAAAPVFADTTFTASTYNFSASATGSTAISATNGTYTAPANPGFCVGPPLACASGSGLSGGFTFADITSTTATITFSFFGSTAGAGPGTFSIDLGNFVIPDHDTVTNVTYASGSLGGATSAVSFSSGVADFNFATGSDYEAIGGNSVVFDVTEKAAVPEPASMVLIGTGLSALYFIRRRRKA